MSGIRFPFSFDLIIMNMKILSFSKRIAFIFIQNSIHAISPSFSLISDTLNQSIVGLCGCCHFPQIFHKNVSPLSKSIIQMRIIESFFEHYNKWSLLGRGYQTSLLRIVRNFYSWKSLQTSCRLQNKRQLCNRNSQQWRVTQDVCGYHRYRQHMPSASHLYLHGRQNYS